MSVETQERILDILGNGDCDRDTFVEKTGVKRSTIYDNLVKMELKGEIEVYHYQSPSKTSGRPVTMYRKTNNRIT